MAIEGTGKAPRNSYMILMNVADTTSEDEWEIIGKDIEELNRALNNEVEPFTNILGETEVDITKGNQATTVDPIKFRRDSKITKILYDIYKYDKELDEVVFEFCEVNTEDKVSDEEFSCFRQFGGIDLKSYGGDAKSLNMPFDINWVGSKIHGTFNPKTKTFTELIV